MARCESYGRTVNPLRENIRTVELSFGTVTIIGDFNYFALNHNERELLRKIMELMDAFEEHKRISSVKVSETKV